VKVNTDAEHRVPAGWFVYLNELLEGKEARRSGQEQVGAGLGGCGISKVPAGFGTQIFTLSFLLLQDNPGRLSDGVA